MSTQRFQAQYGQSTEHNLLGETELIVSPVHETNLAILAVNSAMEARNIDEICAAVRGLAERLRLPMHGADAQEEYLRLQWNGSPTDCVNQGDVEDDEVAQKDRATAKKAREDALIDALRSACVGRLESDIIIQSGRKVATLGQGTHFIEASAESEGDQRGLVIRDANGDESSMNATGRLRARVTVGANENVKITASNAWLLIFSILHGPEQSSMKIQVGDPAHARYLEEKDDKFMAGRHFPAEMMGDPSWHELRLLPNSTQVGFEHIHPHMRLVYVTQGEGTLQTGITRECADQPFNLFPGKLVILTPGTWHRFSTGESGLTVQPVHPVTPTSGASSNSHEMFFGTLSNVGDMQKIIERGATR